MAAPSTRYAQTALTGPFRLTRYQELKPPVLGSRDGSEGALDGSCLAARPAPDQQPGLWVLVKCIPMVLASSSTSKSADRSGASPDGISTLPRLFRVSSGAATWAYDLQEAEEGAPRSGLEFRDQPPLSFDVPLQFSDESRTLPMSERQDLLQARLMSSRHARGRLMGARACRVSPIHSITVYGVHGLAAWYQTGFDPTAAHTCARL